MIDELTDADHIVVARLTVVDHIEMIVGTRAKGAQGVTHATILDRRHVVGRFTGCRNTMTGGAIVHDAGVIEDGVGETLRVMAQPAILWGIRVRRGRRLADRINTIIPVVTVLARL